MQTTHDQKKNKIKKYCACSFGSKFRVGTLGPCGEFHFLGDVRGFTTFDEANTVARDIANGNYGYDRGEYINMR